jgi:hypothetical protein
MINTLEARSSRATRTVSVAVNAALLSSLNLASVIVAFGFYCLLRPPDQVLFQGPVAALIAMISFLVVHVLIGRSSFHSLSPIGWRNAVLVYALAFFLAPLLFIPLHLATQSYLSSFGNIIVIWLFQAPTNALALLAALSLRLPPDPGRQA